MEFNNIKNRNDAVIFLLESAKKRRLVDTRVAKYAKNKAYARVFNKEEMESLLGLCITNVLDYLSITDEGGIPKKPVAVKLSGRREGRKTGKVVRVTQDLLERYLVITFKTKVIDLIRSHNLKKNSVKEYSTDDLVAENMESFDEDSFDSSRESLLHNWGNTQKSYVETVSSGNRMAIRYLRRIDRQNRAENGKWGSPTLARLFVKMVNTKKYGADLKAIGDSFGPYKTQSGDVFGKTVTFSGVRARLAEIKTALAERPDIIDEILLDKQRAESPIETAKRDNDAVRYLERKRMIKPNASNKDGVGVVSVKLHEPVFMQSIETVYKTVGGKRVAVGQKNSYSMKLVVKTDLENGESEEIFNKTVKLSGAEAEGVSRDQAKKILSERLEPMMEDAIRARDKLKSKILGAGNVIPFKKKAA